VPPQVDRVTAALSGVGEVQVVLSDGRHDHLQSARRRALVARQGPRRDVRPPTTVEAETGGCLGGSRNEM
jgi:hypothetical protein